MMRVGCSRSILLQCLVKKYCISCERWWELQGGFRSILAVVNFHFIMFIMAGTIITTRWKVYEIYMGKFSKVAYYIEKISFKMTGTIITNRGKVDGNLKGDLTEFSWYCSVLSWYFSSGYALCLAISLKHSPKLLHRWGFSSLKKQDTVKNFILWVKIWSQITKMLRVFSKHLIILHCLVKIAEILQILIKYDENFKGFHGHLLYYFQNLL